MRTSAELENDDGGNYKIGDSPCGKSREKNAGYNSGERDGHDARDLGDGLEALGTHSSLLLGKYAPVQKPSTPAPAPPRPPFTPGCADTDEPYHLVRPSVTYRPRAPDMAGSWLL